MTQQFRHRFWRFLGWMGLTLWLTAAGPALANSKYSALVLDADSGRILYEENGSAIRHPASLTKIMTLYMTFRALESGQLRLGQNLPVSRLAASQSPSKLGLRAGERIRVDEAMVGLVTESANDAAVVLAEAMGGSEPDFAREMTRIARALGMANTTFRNASGLPDPTQVTTARDMARLALAVLNHYPEQYRIFSRRSFTYDGVTHINHNRLMQRYSGMDGIKTGYIRASGFNLVASATRNGRRLIGVVFGGQSAASRDNHMAKLLDDGFRRVGLGPPTRAVPSPRDRIVVASEESRLAKPASAAGTPHALPARKPSTEAADNASSPAPETAEGNAAAQGMMADATAEAAPVAAIAAKAPWGIQVGAFADPQAGRRAIAMATERAPDLLAGAEPQLVSVQGLAPVPVGIPNVNVNKGSTLYRARFTGLEAEEARAACLVLARQGQTCLTLPPMQGL